MEYPRFFKLTNEHEIHHGFHYQNGMNIDILPFEWNGACCPGGLYFCEGNDILNNMDIYSRFIREIFIPSHEVNILKDPSGDKWRSHSLFTSIRHDLSDIDTVKWMLDNQIIISARYSYYAMINGWNDVYNYIKDNCDINESYMRITL